WRADRRGRGAGLGPRQAHRDGQRRRDRARLPLDDRAPPRTGAPLTVVIGKRQKTPPKPRSSAKARRSAARLAAVQALYEIAQTEKTAAEALAEFIEFRIGHEVDGETFVAADITLLTAIVRGADAERPEIDKQIEAALRPPLERDRLELLLRMILVAGV